MALATATLMPQKTTKRAPAAKPPTASEAPRYSVRTVGRADLGAHRADWESLAQAALEPNCFYEPWMLMPAVEQFDQGVPLKFALVYRTQPGAEPTLCGFFPFERKSRLQGLPVRVLALWRHVHCFLCTPLVHRDHARPALQAILEWARSPREGATLLDFDFVAQNGPFGQALLDVLHERKTLTFPVESFNRALLAVKCDVGQGDAESHIQAALGPKHRRELERMRRRLGELGRLELRVLGSDDDCTPWIEWFLALEASGWKGNTQTALGCTANERRYFTTIVQDGHARNQVGMLGLFLDGAPIALKCNFRAGDGAFAFKIAFSESFDKYSPGVQLELDNIRRAHELPGLAWMDSCAHGHHPMINRLWPERRTLGRTLLSTGGFRGNLLVGLLPLLRSLKRIVRG